MVLESQSLLCFLSFADWWWVGDFRRARTFSLIFQLRFGFQNRVSCVVIRVVLIFRPVVGDALNHDFGGVAAGEGALRVCPIVLGLAFVVAGHRPFTLSVVAKVS